MKRTAPLRGPMAILALSALVCLLLTAGGAAAANHRRRARDVIAFLPSRVRSVSTVPPNGDLNPYGVAFVPAGFPHSGLILPGDMLVSNFNNSQNLPGEGGSILRIPSNGPVSTFFQGNLSQLGLTAALQVLKEGVVIAGRLPTANGTCASARPGSIVVIDKTGAVVNTFTDPALIDGPLDSTVQDAGRGNVELFVSNVLNGTVVRFDLKVSAHGASIIHAYEVASGYAHRCDAVALLVGPTGLVYDPGADTLYVASTEDNEIFAVHGAGRTTHDLGKGVVLYRDPAHLHGPLAMVKAPNGDLLVSNSDVINADARQTSTIVEFTRKGQFVKQLSVDRKPGAAFGIAVAPSFGGARFAAVNDNSNRVRIWTLNGDFAPGAFDP